ncbi:hypothetical protein TNIN_268331 [Trichonephila inaurata madagascariensis]|uniref:Uncharacterized protein n=1 Tax=Trichonephila inaurata madagascariensis TaxID=2747483 RepID=A0A8X7C3Y9_9ARAC|nr:hypothetical protein TNIN_268331 [Trichonephila inaurata madagascariensis]
MPPPQETVSVDLLLDLATGRTIHTRSGSGPTTWEGPENDGETRPEEIERGDGKGKRRKKRGRGKGKDGLTMD